MKLYEEEYNEVHKIGRAKTPEQAIRIVKKIRNIGIDAYNEGNDVIISVEQDRNDPHYVDDMIQMCRNIIKPQPQQEFSQYKLAENETKWICSECIKILLGESAVENVMFAIVKSQARKVIFNKIKNYFIRKSEGDDPQPRTKIEKSVFRVCDFRNNLSQKEIKNVLFSALDELMNAECNKPNMPDYDMFSLINNNLDKYIKF